MLTLQAGRLRAALRPDLGASLAGLWWQDEALLRSVAPEQLEGPRQSACFALLPYSNRIGHCRFAWQGQHHRTRPNFDDHPHSLHGVGWRRPWTVAAQDGASALLKLDHAPDADWPFAFTAEQRLRLEPDALHWSLSLRNTDPRTQPVGLGWHPYFLRRPASRIEAAVSARWNPGADALPRERVAHPPLDAAVDGLRLDHCFDGWSGTAWVSDARQRLRLRASTRRLVVYTPPDQPFFCVEPVSHVNNAVQSADPLAQGLVDLAPGQTLGAWMELHLENA